MNRWRNKYVVRLVLCLWLTVFIAEPLMAQTKRRRLRVRLKDMSSLDLQKKQLQEKVKQTEELLNDTRKVKKRSVSELSLLKKQIALRESLLGSLSRNIESIDQQIEKIDRMILAMESDIQKFQKSYAKASALTYKTNDDLSLLLWLFSADNFYQAYDRLMYFQELARYRRNQILLIKRTRKYLADKKAEKEAGRVHKAVLLQARVEEKKKLDEAVNQKDQILRNLGRTETEYEKEIQHFRSELAEIRNKIRQMIIASKRDITRTKSEAIEKLSHNFEHNKGKLPWPVPMNAGVITGYFGKTTSPTGGEIINDGIFISTKQGQRVRAVFGGTVTMITQIPTYGKVVIVQHGDYRTVYANLEEVFVSKGENVNLLQDVGTVKLNEHTGETQLYFQLYRNFNPINPLGWITYKE
jgi:septal ring factor EnvC (AmiA/AmiB activator)